MLAYGRYLLGALILTASMATGTRGNGIDAVMEFDTGHPLGRHVLEVGVETPLRISVMNTIAGAWPIAAVRFEFDNPDGHLSWDLRGPDDTSFTEDDGFVWESGLDEPPYSARIDPPLTLNLEFFSPDAVHVPAHGTVLLATLMITADRLGESTFSSQDPVLLWPRERPIRVDQESLRVTLLVVPEPSTFGMLGTGGFWLVIRNRRSRRRSGSHCRDPGNHRARFSQDRQQEKTLHRVPHPSLQVKDGGLICRKAGMARPTCLMLEKVNSP